MQAIRDYQIGYNRNVLLQSSEWPLSGQENKCTFFYEANLWSGLNTRQSYIKTRSRCEVWQVSMALKTLCYV
jgi:hypothetical protein